MYMYKQKDGNMTSKSDPKEKINAQTYRNASWIINVRSKPL